MIKIFMKKNKQLKVSIVMGSQTDYRTMRQAEKVLKKIGVSYETRIISAHRTPNRMYDFASNAEKNGIGVIIAMITPIPFFSAFDAKSYILFGVLCADIIRVS